MFSNEQQPNICCDIQKKWSYNVTIEIALPILSNIKNTSNSNKYIFETTYLTSGNVL